MGEEYAECHKPNYDGKLDGCQAFMQAQRDKYNFDCMVCDCHRNFHRKVKLPVKYKTEVVYTKCHKIHDFGSQVSVDGCQEFTTKGKNGTEEALTCAVCGCHKSFHRNEVTKEVTSSTS